MDSSRTLSPVWTRFLETLSQSNRDEIARGFASADRRIRDMGISYRVHGEANERAWPLEHLPLLIGQDEWREIAAGVEQRARLMEAILADVYGPGRLAAQGALPGTAIAGSSDFIRPLAGARPPGGRWLRFMAVDIGRGPDGKWWALGDRAQAPSGAGYALENRLIITGALPRLRSTMNVARLAPFFRDFRAGLSGAADRAAPRMCLLTPGPYSDTYFEQAYLARYLGFLLVEGDDLVVRDNMVFVRTIAGLKRADVIWRRVDADWCDPLELNATSRIGVAGLMQAIRAGNVVVANMPGAGMLESRALLGFAPTLSQMLLGEDLRLPNIATWWCGQKRERESVIERMDELVISPAFGDALPGSTRRRGVLGSDLSAREKTELAQAMERRGIDYVGQEVVRLSTTPVWRDGKLEPRPFILRVYAAATEDGWRVMPGGFCRVAHSPDSRAFTMGDNVSSADVWIAGDRPVEMSTLLPATDSVRVIRLLGNLPSRAADNLFWLGRYLERAEATCLLARCLSARALELDSSSYSAVAAMDLLRRQLIAWGAAEAERTRPADVAHEALSSRAQQGSAFQIAGAARRAASIIRERLSQDSMLLLAELEQTLQGAAGDASESEAFDLAQRALRIIAALSGLMSENVNRVAGWSFLDMGRRVERAVNTCRFVRQFAADGATSENLDVLLDLIDSQITYRSRYVVGPALAAVRDMALLDPYNPRSLGFQIGLVDRHLAALPTLTHNGMPEAPRRLSMKLAADIAVEEAERLDAGAVLAFEQRVTGLAEAISARYFLQGAAGRDEQPSGLS
ncbi:MAG: circularly permuted type 2 ATP-grasp protein [Beijerinckiaceae bacterium]|nr:circularly permuted type 2 ATP-grasp protein [Beijerinckiaceae bacterium]